ncbi:MAG: hypothetical protein ACE5EC_05905 [Phycisphaerae bacterium]
MTHWRTVRVLLFAALFACAGMSTCQSQDGMDDGMLPDGMNPNPNPNPSENGNSNSPPPPNTNGNGNGNDNVNDNSNPPPPPPRDPPEWNAAFITDNNTPMDKTDDAGALSSVWGSGPDDVFVVGGTLCSQTQPPDPSCPVVPPFCLPDKAVIYHYDGSTWKQMSVPNGTLGLVWIFGFSPTDVFAVGKCGAMIHYDGMTWSSIALPDSLKINGLFFPDLWGIWGQSRDTVWIVGGLCGLLQPVLIHFNANTNTFTKVDPFPDTNSRDPCQLLKVWGIGSKTFAVGENGVILEHQGGMNWVIQSPGQAVSEKFVSLWGTSESNIVASGGQSKRYIGHYDGSSWSTYKQLDQAGLNAVYMDKNEPNMAIVGGLGGFLGRYDPATNELVMEHTAPIDIHAVWGDGNGRYYAVGATFLSPYNEGICLVRTYGSPGFTPSVPLPP